MTNSPRHFPAQFRKGYRHNSTVVVLDFLHPKRYYTNPQIPHPFLKGETITPGVLHGRTLLWPPHTPSPLLKPPTPRQSYDWKLYPAYHFL